MISVIVPACGQVALTRRCVASVRKWAAYESADFEIVLVSNGGTAEEGEQLRALCGEGDTFIHFEEMIGYPRAVNEGVRLASGEFLCLLNNDAAFTGPWATRLIKALDHGDVVSPIVDQIGQPCQRLGDFRAPGTLAQVGMLFFVCVVMRRKLFLDMGGLDEGYGLGNSDDAQFCEDLKARGGTLLVEPAVFVTHQGSATFRAVLGEDGWRELMKRNRERFAAGAGVAV